MITEGVLTHLSKDIQAHQSGHWASLLPQPSADLETAEYERGIVAVMASGRRNLPLGTDVAVLVTFSIYSTNIPGRITFQNATANKLAPMSTGSRDGRFGVTKILDLSSS